MEKSSILDFDFEGGFPTEETVQHAYDLADFNRALQSYRFFFPSVSAFGSFWIANQKVGLVPNEVFGILHGSPNQIVFTANSDTPYSGLVFDMSEVGPIVIDVPAGPIMAAADDMNQLWIADIGLPGPDHGQGGKHLILPPGYTGEVPEGYYASTATTMRFLLMLRAMPVGGVDPIEMMKSVKIYPLDPKHSFPEPKWISLDKNFDLTITSYEKGLGFWETLAELINLESVHEPYRAAYGELAELGIKKGEPFAPDERMKKILIKAAQTANALLRVESFADRRDDRLKWDDRQWEWAVTTWRGGRFEAETYTDLAAREKWFYQAQIESVAMFNRAAGAGSLYWLGLKDDKGRYLDGNKNYKLTVPLPVPAKLFWSITVYDSDTRSEIPAEQNKAALRSMFELKDVTGDSVDLYFGPSAPEGHEDHWIQTIPGKGWFTYFRIYGPEEAAFDGSWKLNDFVEV